MVPHTWQKHQQSTAHRDGHSLSELLAESKRGEGEVGVKTSTEGDTLLRRLKAGPPAQGGWYEGPGGWSTEGVASDGHRRV